MTTTITTTSDNLDAITAGGIKTLANRQMPKGLTLANATTYFVSLQAMPQDSPYLGVHLKWDAALVAEITFESTEFPAFLLGSPSVVDVSDQSVVNGEWLQHEPVTVAGDVPIVGGTETNLTITVPGGTVGGARVDLGNLGALRMRVKIVVTTGGNLRVAGNGKGS